MKINRKAKQRISQRRLSRPSKRKKRHKSSKRERRLKKVSNRKVRNKAIRPTRRRQPIKNRTATTSTSQKVALHPGKARNEECLGIEVIKS